MKISVQDVSHVNWDEVAKRITAECIAAASKVVDEARTTLGELKPGERRTLTVKVGSITVSVPKS